MGKFRYLLKKIELLFLLVISFEISGCSSNNYKQITVKEAVEECGSFKGNNKYHNICYSDNLVVKCIDTSNFNLLSFDLDSHDYSVSEGIELIERYLCARNVFLNEKIAENLYITQQIYKENEDNFNSMGMYKAYDNLLPVPCGNNLWLSINNTIGIQTLNGGIYSYCNNTMKKFVQDNEDNDMLLGAFGKYTSDIVTSYNNVDLTLDTQEELHKDIMLCEGKQSIASVVEFVNDNINTMLLNDNNKEEQRLTYKVKNVDVVKIGEKNAICCQVIETYEGIEVANIEDGIYDSLQFEGNTCYVYVAANNEISAFREYNDRYVINQKSINQIYSISNSIDKLSYYISKNIEFEIQYISLVYANVNIEQEHYQPGWLVRGKDKLTDMKMDFFIDAETMDIYVNSWR